MCIYVCTHTHACLCWLYPRHLRLASSREKEDAEEQKEKEEERDKERRWPQVQKAHLGQKGRRGDPRGLQPRVLASGGERLLVSSK